MKTTKNDFQEKKLKLCDGREPKQSRGCDRVPEMCDHYVRFCGAVLCFSGKCLIGYRYELSTVVIVVVVMSTSIVLNILFSIAF